MKTTTAFFGTFTAALGVLTALWCCSASGQNEKPAVPTPSESSTLSITKARAESGDKEAQLSLGWIYERGEAGVLQNMQQAFAWWLKAADQEQPYAQFNVAVDYYSGQGVAQNYNDAANWYCKTTPPMDSPALFKLGLLYFAGKGVAKDYAKATSLWEEAQSRGHAFAQKELSFVETTYVYPDWRVYTNHWTVAGNVQMATNTPVGITALKDYQLAKSWLALDTVTFIDKDGVHVENAKVVKVTPVSILYTADGAWFKEEKLSDLPPDLQRRFDYNPQKAAAYEAGLRESFREAELSRQGKALKFPPDLHEAADSVNIRTVSDIVSNYVKGNTYMGKDTGYAEQLYDCKDMAGDVWNQVTKAGINAVYAVGNVDEECTFFDHANHAWVLAETDPVEHKWLALEATRGYVVSSAHNIKYYYPLSYFNSPELFRQFYEYFHQWQTAVAKAKEAQNAYSDAESEYNNASGTNNKLELGIKMSNLRAVFEDRESALNEILDKLRAL